MFCLELALAITIANRRAGGKSGGQGWGPKLRATMISGPGIPFAATGELEARLGAKAGGHDDFEAGDPLAFAFPFCGGKNPIMLKHVLGKN